MGLGKQALYTMPVLVLHFDDIFALDFLLKWDILLKKYGV